MVMMVNAEPLQINQALGMNAEQDIVLINGTGIFLTTGDSWDFYQDYSLNVKSVNQDGKQVWVQLFHGNEFLKDGILPEGGTFAYSKNNEILNITVDTIYISPGGELITFKPVYQYLDNDYPEPEIEEIEDAPGQDDDLNSSGNSPSAQADGFTIFQAFACVSTVMLCRSVVKRTR